MKAVRSSLQEALRSMALIGKWRVTWIHLLLAACALFFGFSPVPACAKLTQQTSSAFDRYVAQAESCMQRGAPAKPKDQKLRIEAGATPDTCRETEVPNATVQNWRGTVFFANATIDEVKSVLQDYRSYKNIYPEVTESREISHAGDEFNVYLRLTRNLSLISVALNSEYHVKYVSPDPRHLTVISHSTHIAEIKDPRKSLTEEKPAGDDLGLLWRLNTYWDLEAADGGVYATCRAISLSRDVPLGLGTILKGFLEKFPKESMQETLEKTQAEVARRHHKSTP